MRLWFLILLCLVSFVPVPVAIWFDALEKNQVAKCGDDFCRVRLLDWSAPETLMPPAQQQPFDKTQTIKQGYAQPRQQGEACKHSSYFQPIAGLYDAPSKAGTGAGAGYKLGNDGTDQRQAAGNFRTCEH